MLKRLWYIFGPILVSIILLIAFLLVAPNKTEHKLYDEKRAATALTSAIFKNAALKKEAFSDPNHRFVPFFGSSEWLRLDELHPSILSEAYNRDYTPFLLGLAGTQSITQYFGMKQIQPALKHKQAVFVVSPQWFTKNGEKTGAFTNFFSTDQAYQFLENAKNNTNDRYAAKRFIEKSPSSSINKFMTKIAKGEQLNRLEKFQISLQKTLVLQEDKLFAGLQFNRRFQDVIEPRAKSLPQPYDKLALQDKANYLGKKNTSNNNLGILNSLYTKTIKPKRGKLKNFQKHWSYVKSPEYNDFQLVLSEFAKNHTDVIFVIPPVNAKWQALTGLNEKMYQKTVSKIKYQLSSQGFNQVADLSRRGHEKYFMQDTIHLGWKGWLAFDNYVNPFLTKKQPTPSYKLNDYFLSKDWANQTTIDTQK